MAAAAGARSPPTSAASPAGCRGRSRGCSCRPPIRAPGGGAAARRWARGSAGGSARRAGSAPASGSTCPRSGPARWDSTPASWLRPWRPEPALLPSPAAGGRAHQGPRPVPCPPPTLALESERAVAGVDLAPGAGAGRSLVQRDTARLQEAATLSPASATSRRWLPPKRPAGWAKAVGGQARADPPARPPADRGSRFQQQRRRPQRRDGSRRRVCWPRTAASPPQSVADLPSPPEDARLALSSTGRPGAHRSRPGGDEHRGAEAMLDEHPAARARRGRRSSSRRGKMRLPDPAATRKLTGLQQSQRLDQVRPTR